MDRAPDFLRACRRLPTSTRPVWILRQAGRYMKEYRDLRARVPFLKLCKSPDLCAETAVTAAERLGVDAAILFSDILLLLEPMGFRLTYEKGEGPVIHNPVRSPGDLRRVRAADPGSMDYVYRAVKATRAALPSRTPLIGFSGAPFTLAAYAIEGGSSRDFLETKRFMYRHPEAWHLLLDRMARSVSGYLKGQARAGAEALQLFDSWVGCLSPADYREYVLPHSRKVFRALPKGVPSIHFGTRTGGLLELLAEAGGDVIGIDPTVGMDAARRRVGARAVQGNLDPVVLLGPLSEVRRQALRVLREAGSRPGHIFNLGHGVLPSTPVDHVRALVDLVHSA